MLRKGVIAVCSIEIFQGVKCSKLRLATHCLLTLSLWKKK